MSNVRIKNLGEMTVNDLQWEVEKGGRFVMYRYAISIFIMTFRRSSSIYWVPSDQSRVVKGLGFTFLTLFFGWWGIPWGPIYSIQSLWHNLTGGINVTSDVMDAILQGRTVEDLGSLVPQS